MRQERRAGLAVLAGLLCLASAAAPGADSGGKIPVDPISYENLGKLVRSLRGKVVVVSFWAQY